MTSHTFDTKSVPTLCFRSTSHSRMRVYGNQKQFKSSVGKGIVEGVPHLCFFESSNFKQPFFLVATTTKSSMPSTLLSMHRWKRKLFRQPCTRLQQVEFDFYSRIAILHDFPQMKMIKPHHPSSCTRNGRKPP